MPDHMTIQHRDWKKQKLQKLDRRALEARLFGKGLLKNYAGLIYLPFRYSCKRALILSRKACE